jgi:hypothetical protein
MAIIFARWHFAYCQSFCQMAYSSHSNRLPRETVCWPTEDETMTKRYYTRAITSKGIVNGYGVYDCVGGLESEHERFPISEDAKDRAEAAKATLYLANTFRDDLNNGAA